MATPHRLGISPNTAAGGFVGTCKQDGPLGDWLDSGEQRSTVQRTCERGESNPHAPSGTDPKVARARHGSRVLRVVLCRLVSSCAARCRPVVSKM